MLPAQVACHEIEETIIEQFWFAGVWVFGVGT